MFMKFSPADSENREYFINLKKVTVVVPIYNINNEMNLSNLYIYIGDQSYKIRANYHELCGLLENLRMLE